jgi:hypothetical protein
LTSPPTRYTTSVLSKLEAYRVRFEDGSAREITYEDLSRYGSETMAGALPTLDQAIRWIEVVPHESRSYMMVIAKVPN